MKSSEYLTKEQQEEICYRYQNGETITVLSKYYNRATSSINSLLTRRNIIIRKRVYENKYNADYNYFKEIDTEEKAYWLGFIAADGSVTNNTEHRMLYIRLGIEDKEHLVKFLSDIKATHTVKEYEYKNKCCQIVINSKQLVEDLAQWGIIQRKTYNLVLPDISDHLMRHYIRGYFDGDGSFTYHAVSGRKHKDPEFNITGLDSFVEKIQDILIKECGLSKTKMDYRFDDQPWAQFKYVGRLQVCRIYHYLYDDANVYLTRKFDSIQPYLNGIVLNNS
jgi:hypothetical protein